MRSCQLLWVQVSLQVRGPNLPPPPYDHLLLPNTAHSLQKQKTSITTLHPTPPHHISTSTFTFTTTPFQPNPGRALVDLLDHAKDAGFAIPGVNIVGTNSINSCMEAAKRYGGPIMVTFSKGGGQFIAGKGANNDNDAASIAGCVAGAKHVREVAELYGVPVILHTDHCQKAWLPWMDGLLDANEKYFAQHGEPLFSSHMLDLSEEPLEENIGICKQVNLCEFILTLTLT